MRFPVFDLDGTLLDTDATLRATFVALGVPADEVTFGHVLADECERLGLTVEEYLDHYDETSAQPFPGVTELVAALDRWAVCSNKHPRSGRAELARLGWAPEVALFSDAFGGPKQLEPVLDALGSDRRRDRLRGRHRPRPRLRAGRGLPVRAGGVEPAGPAGGHGPRGPPPDGGARPAGAP